MQNKSTISYYCNWCMNDELTLALQGLFQKTARMSRLRARHEAQLQLHVRAGLQLSRQAKEWEEGFDAPHAALSSARLRSLCQFGDMLQHELSTPAAPASKAAERDVACATWFQGECGGIKAVPEGVVTKGILTLVLAIRLPALFLAADLMEAWSPWGLRLVSHALWLGGIGALS